MSDSELDQRMDPSKRSALTFHATRPARVRLAQALCGCVLLLLAVSACSGGVGPQGHTKPIKELKLDVRSEVATPELTAGWVGFLEGLAEARRGLEDPVLYPPAPSDRNLAEGYRYLLGHLARIIESQTQGDPRFPYLQRSVRMLSKWTIDNPDTMYLSSAVDAEGIYRVRGRVAYDASEWQTSARGRSGMRAPRVVIFQTTTATVGDTGSLAEMAACRNQTLDSLDQFDIELDENHSFEILIASERPAGYDGLFLSSRKTLPCVGPDGQQKQRVREATQLNVREIFSDWENEIPIELEIVREDMQGAPRPPRTSAEMGRDLGEIGRKLGNQIKFWNALHEIGLEIKGDRNGDGRLAFPLNGLNPAAPPFIAGGTAGAGQLYSAGTFELEDDEALIVRIDAPLEPHYLGFQLGNLWGESLDQANYVSSQTGGQNPVASDGARYYVVSAQDPGTPGWLDTTGLPKVTMSLRFIYPGAPNRDEWPEILTFAVKTRDVRSRLPHDTPVVSTEERRAEVDVRQRHIQRRWRQY